MRQYNAEEAEPWVDHLYNIWCKRDNEVFDYVLKRFALLVQRPFFKSKVAIVLTSRQGAGKGVIMAPIQEIFGKYFKVLKPEMVFGAFNDSISDCLVLFLDECTFAGNRKIAAQLKTLITEDTHHINAKYLPSITLDNHLNVFMATNESWSAAVEESDRRQFVLELDNKYAGKSTPETHRYFRKIRDVPYQAVYKFLMNVDIKGFIPYIYPTTEATREQKLYSMDSVTAWVHQSLEEGTQWTLVGSSNKQDLYEDYKLHFKNNSGSYGNLKPFSQFITQVRKIVGVSTDKDNKNNVTIPELEEMKNRLRNYMNDMGFPV